MDFLARETINVLQTGASFCSSSFQRQRQCQRQSAIALLFIVCICLLPSGSDSLKTAEPENDVPLWGTYRPHALMSVRARVPHSPFFGFMYHPPASAEIRHLAADQSSSIRSFGFTRHDGATFSDHRIDDVQLNAIVSSSFVKHPTDENSWTLRISGSILDHAKGPKRVSIVFYAAAGPEEVVSQNSHAGPWGTIAVQAGSGGDSTNVPADVVLDGNADSIGGRYQVVVKEPHLGAVSRSEPDDVEGSSSSRRMRRRRSSRQSTLRDISGFRLASPPISPEKSFLVDDILRGSLTAADEAVSTSRKVSSSTSSESDPGKGGHSEVESGPPENVDGGEIGIDELLLLPNNVDSSSPVVLIQRVLSVPFEMDVVFKSLSISNGSDDALISNGELCGPSLDVELASRRVAFDTRFEDIFHLSAAGYKGPDISFARSALANILGGIGYFYGSTAVSKDEDDSGTLREPMGLLTATPSRALFPRGFLWDEGFHQLLVQRWNGELTRACLSSWLGQMDKDGWIPREQVLGLEARHRFPAHVRHLMVQRPTVANPPTLLMPFRVFAVLSAGNESSGPSCRVAEEHEMTEGACAVGAAARTIPSVAHDLDGAAFWHGALDRTVSSFRWLLRTQAGKEPGSFRWRGRSSHLAAPEGYPLTLASGLDDYPRGSHVRREERHLDLHCWVAWAAGALSKLHRAAGKDATEFDKLHIRMVESLDVFHERVEPVSQEHSQRGVRTEVPASTEDPEKLLLCDFDGESSSCEVGYVTILPLVLGLLDPSSPRVGAILDLLEGVLRSPGGIRSLSSKSQYYRKGNDYWTGSVWMPFNFLTLAALRTKYSVEDGPFKARAAALHISLKNEILNNARQEWERSGFLWENYSPDTGEGKSGRQFTGWSALVVLIYGDLYEGVV